MPYKKAKGLFALFMISSGGFPYPYIISNYLINLSLFSGSLSKIMSISSMQSNWLE